MKLKYKLAIGGLILGSIGPFIMFAYYFFTKTPAGPEWLLFFPFSIFTMEFEGLPFLQSLIYYLLLSGLNLVVFGVTGLLIGWIIKRLKAH